MGRGVAECISRTGLRWPLATAATNHPGRPRVTLSRQEVDAETETAWGEEINRRIAAIDSGTARLVPADEVFAEVRRLMQGGMQ